MLPTLEDIERQIRARTPLIGARDDDIPTFGYSRDFAHPHIEVNAAGLHYVVEERGQELVRYTTTDTDLLLWYVFDAITSTLASNYELRHRARGKDIRRTLFARQVKLLAVLSPVWADRTIAEHHEILQRHPFDDASLTRADYTERLQRKGVPPTDAWAQACAKYPLPTPTPTPTP